MVQLYTCLVAAYRLTTGELSS